MRLLGVELTRLRWRRAIVVLLAASALIPAVIFGAVAWETRPVTAADLAEARAMAEREREQPYIQDEIERCVEDPEQYGVVPGTDDGRAACEQTILPRAEWFLDRQPLDLQQQFHDLAGPVVIVLFVLLLLAGATFVGADWNSGSMSNQLLFEPRRLRVWATKGAALAFVGAVTAAVVQAGFWLAMSSLARARGLDVAERFGDLLPGTIGRGVVLVAGAAVLGYSLTMLFRSTVATLGIVFAVAVAGTLVIAALPLGGENERWMVQTNLLAFVQDGVDYYNSQREVTCVGDRSGMVCTGQSRLTLAAAGGYLGTILVACGALGLTSFLRRDVP